MPRLTNNTYTDVQTNITSHRTNSNFNSNLPINQSYSIYNQPTNCRWNYEHIVSVVNANSEYNSYARKFWAEYSYSKICRIQYCVSKDKNQLIFDLFLNELPNEFNIDTQLIMNFNQLDYLINLIIILSKNKNIYDRPYKFKIQQILGENRDIMLTKKIIMSFVDKHEINQTIKTLFKLRGSKNQSTINHYRLTFKVNKDML